jgi:hypothetical protein
VTDGEALRRTSCFDCGSRITMASSCRNLQVRLLAGLDRAPKVELTQSRDYRVRNKELKTLNHKFVNATIDVAFLFPHIFSCCSLYCGVMQARNNLARSHEEVNSSLT